MSKNKSMCSGCYNDIYNHGCGGSKECWGYETAVIVKKKLVGIDDVPPYKHTPKKYLSCYRPQRMFLIDADRTY